MAQLLIPLSPVSERHAVRAHLIPARACASFGPKIISIHHYVRLYACQVNTHPPVIVVRAFGAEDPSQATYPSLNILSAPFPLVRQTFAGPAVLLPPWHPRS
jgi:hypothetical protein